jgi:hypothetical protein
VRLLIYVAIHDILIVESYMQFIYVATSMSVSDTFPEAMCPTLCLDLRLHVTTSPSISSQCGDLGIKLAIRLLIILLYTKRTAVTQL